MWNKVYQTYMADQELSDWVKQNNPPYQSMTARMLETARKERDASDDVLKSLAENMQSPWLKTGLPAATTPVGILSSTTTYRALYQYPVLSKRLKSYAESLKQERTEEHRSSNGQTSVAEKLNQTANQTPKNRSATRPFRILIRIWCGFP